MRKSIKLTDEHKRHISESQIGHIVTEKTRKLISEKNKGNHNCGGLRKHKTPEHNKKVSDALKNHPVSEESRKKMSNSRMGRLQTLEQRQHESAVKQGIPIDKWTKFISIEPYDQKFDNVFKRTIRKRDNHECMLCGVHQEKLSMTLHIHHINYDKQLTIPENCVSLCSSCHMKTICNRKHWVNFFQSMLNEKYGYHYENCNVILNLEENKLL